MPEPSSAPETSPLQERKPAPERASTDAGHMPMTEEMDSAKWRLPPVIPVVASALVLALVFGIFAWIFSRPVATGQILTVSSAEQATKDSVLVGLNVTVKNVSKDVLYIKKIHAEMMPAGQNKDESLMKDDAASAVDFDRYFEAYPVLAQNKMEPLRPETKLQPGESQQGMVIVAFPVNQQAFSQRQSLRVLIDFYNHSIPARLQ